ncbi:MAG: glycerophosphodiester phosphodiesterase [Prolixibacteraceae bacterium]|mgnify:CR=1 FL=1|jgi:glycerophosphoryl diester phosphodiesterase|nr:glycerophosphodiester phosphodiesterase [Prolixibacteraceae bacterium]MBT6006862.1 glycerophosphodiester phosphodiesterase [Prolixibacteraceae bacterium]MBT6766049.1 glycerophosphodiester phosphodiesterase [Prolixibacteraceae bacterium]MBT6998639.1 glycerophosphodiester phosphodiesterase [Prolixibacteraceae bacterium]MBT7397440.1 glycerophosphodiester phosphodiesterase [Prolixibacteraceae bacterium]
MKLQITFILISFVMNSFAQNTFIAHRGASYLAPENTVASAKLAWELGADAVEVDVYLSKDNRVMVIHDKDTKRTCSGKKNLTIKDSPSILLRDLDAGVWKDEKYKGEKIPFLSEIIETVPENKTLVVEIKCGSEVLPALKRCVEKSGKQEQIIFIAFGWNTILDTKNEFPDNKCYWLSAIKPGLKNKMKQAAEKGLDGINLRYSIVDKELVVAAKELNLEVLTWTVDDPVEAKRLTEIGVTGITTNRPKWLKEEMAKL